MTGAGAMTIREAARRMGRDVKAGILQKTEKGQIIFPYDVVHVDFVLKAA